MSIIFRPSSSARLLRQSVRTARSSYKSSPSSKRFLTTEPPHKTSRSWKNGATRWALAIGGVYWYNTTPIFAEQPQYTVQGQEAPLPTLESLSRSARFTPPSQEDLPVLPVQPSSSSPPSIDPKAPLEEPIDAPPQSAESLESEAASQGAFNEETGEINWDCPCLGGMAHGPCGPEFREAFSCFVFSKEEPKGMDCVEKFKGMQTCFRAHPEEYGDQLDEDEEEIERELAEQELSDNGEGISTPLAGGVTAALKEKITQDASTSGNRADATKEVMGADDSKIEESPTQRTSKSTKRSIYDSDSDDKQSSPKNQA